MAFLEVLPQLTGKLLVTDFYHQEEALFIDYLVKGLDNVTRTSRKNDSRQERIAANEAAREWVERITYEFITDDKGNRKIEFSQDNTTPLEELIANRKSGQKPKKPTIDETSDESTEVQETEEVEEIVDETEEVTDTDENTSESTDVFDLGEDDTAEIENALEDAPEIMLSRAEKAAQANQQEDESLEDALERTSTELNLDKPQVIHKILDKLMLANALAGFGNQDEETNDYFKEMILALTNYLDDPKVVINDKAVIPTFNGETNTVEVKLSENLLRDIASALIKQSTLDIADEVNNYSIKDYRELAEDAKYQPGILTKDEIAYAKHIANINNKLQTVKEKIAASLETRSV
ncbi:hypothetical protein IH776_27805, partial [Escherichia coli]|nr:hypothetical protein [Escherichia coli]